MTLRELVIKCLEAVANLIHPEVKSLPAPTPHKIVKPSMVLAEMVALELLKCEFSDTIKNIPNSGQRLIETSRKITTDKFTITCTNYQYLGYGHYYDKCTWNIVVGDYRLEGDEEIKIISAALAKADVLIQQRKTYEKAMERQQKAVDALAAWVKTDPKLLEDTTEDVKCLLASNLCA